MLAHGRVTITFKSPSGTHVTILAKAKAPINDKWVQVPLADAKIIWLEVPNPNRAHGPEGYNDRVGKFTASKGFVPSPGADPARVYCAKALLSYVRGHAVDGRLEIKVEDKCALCGHQLTDPLSIERGLGPECVGKATGSTHQKKAKKFDWGKDYTVDGTSKRAPKPRAKPKKDQVEIIIPEVIGICTECEVEDNTVLFGYCTSCHSKWDEQKEVV